MAPSLVFFQLAGEVPANPFEDMGGDGEVFVGEASEGGGADSGRRGLDLVDD